MLFCIAGETVVRFKCSSFAEAQLLFMQCQEHFAAGRSAGLHAVSSDRKLQFCCQLWPVPKAVHLT